MGFLNGFIFYACEFIALILIATAGVFIGKKLRDKKDAKKIMEAEKETTASLVRGVLAQLAQGGYKVAGFDMYAVSSVLPGSGLSSSAACEVLLGTAGNHLFCGDAYDAVTIARIGQKAENIYFGKPS